MGSRLAVASIANSKRLVPPEVGAGALATFLRKSLTSDRLDKSVVWFSVVGGACFVIGLRLRGGKAEFFQKCVFHNLSLTFSR